MIRRPRWRAAPGFGARLGLAVAIVCVIALSAAAIASADPNGWGVPSVVGKGQTWLLPAGSQVFSDCNSTDTTSATGCVFADFGTSTASTGAFWCTADLNADVSNTACYFGTQDVATALTGTNTRNLFLARPRCNASDAATANCQSYGTLAPITASGGRDTAFFVASSYDYAILAKSGNWSAANYSPTFETINDDGTGSDSITFKIPDSVTSGAAGDFAVTMGAGASADDTDWTWTLQDTSQIVIDANTNSSALAATDAPLEMTWTPTSGATRYGVLWFSTLTANASDGTALLRLDMDDADSAALSSGAIVSAIDVVPSYSSTDNAAAIRAGLTVRAPATASSGLDTAILIVDGSNIMDRVIKTASTSALMEVPTLRGSFTAYHAAPPEGATFGGAYLDSSVTIRGVTATWAVTGTNGGSQFVTFQVSCAAVTATCTVACDVAANTPTRCTLSVNNAADQVCTVQITSATDCTANPTGINAAVDYNYVP